MIARSTDRCAINGSSDGAAQWMDRANPSIARNSRNSVQAMRAERFGKEVNDMHTVAGVTPCFFQADNVDACKPKITSSAPVL